MKLVIYRGPGHVLKAGTRTLYRGEAQSISEELYRRLSADPSNRLVVIEPEAPEPPAPEPPADEAAPDTADQGEEESD